MAALPFLRQPLLSDGQLGDHRQIAMRVVRTTEVPRLVENGGDLCLSVAEYYDFALDFVRAYLEDNLKMPADIWRVIQFMPKEMTYRHRPVIGSVRQSAKMVL